MPRRHPPVARRMRPAFYVLRVASTVLLLLALFVAGLLVDAGYPWRAITAAVAGIGFAVATWMSPFSTGMRVAAGIAAVAIAIASGSVWFLLVFAVLAVVLFFAIRLARIRVDPASVRAMPSDEVMRGAEGLVGQFEGLGWQQVGAVGFDVLRRTVVESLLLSPDRTRYASVTDMVVTVTSQIDDIRSLVTRNAAAGELPLSVLSNDIVGGSPVELAEAHELALSLVAPFGAEPVPQVAELLVQRVIDEEVAALEAVGGAAQAAGPRAAEVGPIDGSPASLERVRRWLGLPAGA